MFVEVDKSNLANDGTIVGKSGATAQDDTMHEQETTQGAGDQNKKYRFFRYVSI